MSDIGKQLAALFCVVAFWWHGLAPLIPIERMIIGNYYHAILIGQRQELIC